MDKKAEFTRGDLVLGTIVSAAVLGVFGALAVLQEPDLALLLGFAREIGTDLVREYGAIAIGAGIGAFLIFARCRSRRRARQAASGGGNEDAA